MSPIDERLKSLNIVLPDVMPPVVDGYVPAFAPFTRSGDQIHLSGRLGKEGGKLLCGKVGEEISLDQGKLAARHVAIDLLAVLKAAIGDLGCVRRIVKLFVMVNGSPHFTEPHRVADGASVHLHKVFRRPIRNSVRFREVRCAVDHDKELYDSSNAAKIADGGFKHGQQFNCHVARGELPLIQANLFAHFPAEELTALLAKAAREMNLVAGTSERRERRHISVDDWRHDVGQNNVERLQALVNGRHALLPSAPSP